MLELQGHLHNCYCILSIPTNKIWS